MRNTYCVSRHCLLAAKGVSLFAAFFVLWLVACGELLAQNAPAECFFSEDQALELLPEPLGERWVLLYSIKDHRFVRFGSTTSTKEYVLHKGLQNKRCFLFIGQVQGRGWLVSQGVRAPDY